MSQKWWRVRVSVIVFGQPAPTVQEYTLQAETRQNASAEAKRLEKERTPGAGLQVVDIRPWR